MILKVTGSNPVFHPMRYSLVSFILEINYKYKNIYILDSLILKLSFIPSFFKFNNNILNEGLLIDFLQKKSMSLFIKKFVFKTFYIFNDRYIFEKLIFYFIDQFIWTKNFFLIQEFNTISFFFQYLIFLLCLIISFLLIICVRI